MNDQLDTVTIGKMIKEKRKVLKMTQKELADKLGVVNTAVLKYEQGKIKNIPLEIRIKLIQILGLPESILPLDTLNITTNKIAIGSHITKDIQKTISDYVETNVEVIEHTAGYILINPGCLSLYDRQAIITYIKRLQEIRKNEFLKAIQELEKI